jgi:hypothetical protein
MLLVFGFLAEKIKMASPFFKVQSTHEPLRNFHLGRIGSSTLVSPILFFCSSELSSHNINKCQMVNMPRAKIC